MPKPCDTMRKPEDSLLMEHTHCAGLPCSRTGAFSLMSYSVGCPLRRSALPLAKIGTGGLRGNVQFLPTFLRAGHTASMVIDLTGMRGVKKWLEIASRFGGSGAKPAANS